MTRPNDPDPASWLAIAGLLLAIGAAVFALATAVIR